MATGTVIAVLLLGCATPQKPLSAPLNGCDPKNTTDLSQHSEVEIRFGDDYAFEYVPKCIRVSRGTRIRFRGNLETHPLVPGRFASGIYEEEAGSPMQEIGEGNEASFVFTEAGAFGFLCYIHVVNGMMGAIFVE